MAQLVRAPHSHCGGQRFESPIAHFSNLFFIFEGKRDEKLAITNLKAQLASLVQLQTLDTQIYALENEKEAKPQEVKTLEDAFEQKKQNLADLEKELLDQYCNLATDDEGHIFEYTEQDIYEQLRKKLLPYEKNR